MLTYFFTKALSWWWGWRAKGIADPVARLRYLRRATTGQTRAKAWKLVWRPRALAAALALGFLLLPGDDNPQAASRSGPLPGIDFPLLPPEDPIPDVWMVERQEGYEVYSNGLRIETAATVHNERRAYYWMDRADGEIRTDGARPAGILFHLTESNITPFEKSRNGRLQRVGQWLLDYVRDHRSYHYLIDRFGRVHRVVAEEDSADHAGMSVWADPHRVYFGLNQSFLGVALEGATSPGDELPETVTEAQIRAVRALTEMLRSRYEIPAYNCITHAQASINRFSMRIGNHTDWASNFPFPELGLADNYSLPIPAIYLFGFGYDREFMQATGSRVWKGLALSEDRLRQLATGQGMTVAAYRKQLQEEFKRITSILPDREDAATEGQ